MAITFNDNVQTNAPKASENRSGVFSAGVWIPYASIAAANNAVLSAYRHKGLRVMITEGSTWSWYTYRDGVLDANLVKEDGIIDIITYTSNQAAAITDSGNKIVFLDCTGGNVTYTVSPPTFSGRTIKIMGIVPGANFSRVTISSGTFVGQPALNYDLMNGECVTFFSNGTDFYVIAKN